MISTLTRQSLAKIKSRALRKRIWFRTLSKIERSIIDLTIKCVEKVRSQTLAQTISSIIGTILKTLEKGFLANSEKLGREIADKLSRIAQEWGNRNALNWKRDRDFIRYLGICAVNE